MIDERSASQFVQDFDHSVIVVHWHFEHFGPTDVLLNCAVPARASPSTRRALATGSDSESDAHPALPVGRALRVKLDLASASDGRACRRRGGAAAELELR